MKICEYTKVLYIKLYSDLHKIVVIKAELVPNSCVDVSTEECMCSLRSYFLQENILDHIYYSGCQVNTSVATYLFL